MLDCELFFGPPERTRRTLARPGRTVDADDLTRRLRLAVDAGHDPLVRLLLDAHADADSPNNRSVMPLYAAARSGRLAVVETMLDAGASAGAVCPGDGRTPLHGAAYSGEAEVAARLLAADA
jgi:ankyrin repeat protein